MTARRTVSTRDTPSLSLTNRSWRELPPRSSSSSLASLCSGQMKCWAMILPSQAGSTWVTLITLSRSELCICLITGEYVKDVDDILLPREPLLDQKFPRPIVERGYCSGIWSTIDDNAENKRDCNEEYPQPLSAFGSDVEFWTFYFFNIIFISRKY